MNLAKHDAETEMEMDMTPMIDVVFLLIIFFMIITDMTQQELEDLELPVAVTAVEDKPDPKEVRPIVNIMHDGTFIVKKETYFDPEAPDDYKKFAGYLADHAARMLRTSGPDKKWEYMNIEAQSGPKLPDDPLLIRADQVTEFRYIQKAMEQCGLEGVRIWKVELAAAQPEADKDE